MEGTYSEGEAWGIGLEWRKYKVSKGINIIPCGRLCTKVGTHVCQSAPQEWSTAYRGQGTGRGMSRLRDVSRRSHMIEWDQIVMVGVMGSNVTVTGHMIVTVVTHTHSLSHWNPYPGSRYRFSARSSKSYPQVRWVQTCSITHGYWQQIIKTLKTNTTCEFYPVPLPICHLHQLQAI